MSTSDLLRNKAFMILVFLALPAKANQVWIRVLEVAATSARVEVGWENGWGSHPETRNHDAVWAFAKGTSDQALGYSHLLIRSAEVVQGNFRDSVPADRGGVFVIPKHPGGFNRDSCTLIIEFEQPIQDFFQAFGVELAYHPAGSFYIGDGSSNFSFISQPDSLPILIRQGEALHFGSQAGNVGFKGIPGFAFRLDPSWPNGSDGFFLMKYELSQVQYRDFFNSLSSDQRQAIWARRGSAEATFAQYGDGHRNGLKIDGMGFLQFANGLGPGLHVACNFLAWDDLLAWLDWAALRPITEMEFEKACRGPKMPVEKEFAWGTQQAYNVTGLVEVGTDREQPATETPLPNAGNAVFGAVFGQPYLNAPVRQGFAASQSSARISAGAGYYGAFELSGSLWEMCVKAAPEAVGFTANPGDGALSEAAREDEGWPDATGAITRGGGCNSLTFNALSYPFRDLAVSDRFYHALRPDQRLHTVGGRGGR